MEIQITQAHIDEAIKNKDQYYVSISSRCVVALALQEALNNPEIICGWTEVELDHEIIGSMSAEASYIVRAFDKNEFELLKPTTFQYWPKDL